MRHLDVGEMEHLNNRRGSMENHSTTVSTPVAYIYLRGGWSREIRRERGTGRLKIQGQLAPPLAQEGRVPQ